MTVQNLPHPFPNRPAREPIADQGVTTQKVGQTPWSARVPLDPLFALQNQPDRPARGPAADQGVID